MPSIKLHKDISRTLTSIQCAANAVKIMFKSLSEAEHTSTLHVSLYEAENTRVKDFMRKV